jgi:cytochrome c55X
MASRLAILAVVALAIAAPAAAEDGKRLEHMVQQDCGSCHGLTMKGGLGRPLTQEALDGLDPQTIASIILDGVPGTAMPPWRPLLREDEALWIANYLKKGITR